MHKETLMKKIVLVPLIALSFAMTAAHAESNPEIWDTTGSAAPYDKFVSVNNFGKLVRSSLDTESLTKTNDEMKQQISDLNRTVSDLQRKVDDMNRTNSDNQSKISSLEKSISDLSSKIK
jgi:peptidoglycan hydrolase CwlO-like protein